VSDEAAIEVENLVREFRKGPRAVDGIDLAVRALDEWCRAALS
jgi:hypothetical protein